MFRTSTILGVSLALIGAAQLNASAEEVKLDQVPASARAVISKHVKDGKIDDIDRETKNKKVIYDVEFRDEKGVKYEMVVGEDGRVLQQPNVCD